MKNTFLILVFVWLLPLFCFGQSQERIIELPKFSSKYNMKWLAVEKPVQADGGKSDQMISRKPVETDEVALGLVEIKIEGKSISPGKSFTASDDWLKDLTIKLKNISDKPIPSINVNFSIPDPNNDRYGMGLTLKYNQPKRNPNAEKEKTIMPGETVELVFTEKQYEGYKNVWMQKMGTTVFNRILWGSITAIFEDGSMIMTSNPPRVQ